MKENLKCPDDCPLQVLCAEIIDTYEYTVIGLNDLKERGTNISASMSDGIAEARQAQRREPQIKEDELIGGHLRIIDMLLDISLEEDHLIYMSGRELGLWKTVAETLRARCRGVELKKKYLLLGEQAIKCAFDTADVLAEIQKAQDRLIDDAAAEAFGIGIEDS